MLLPELCALLGVLGLHFYNVLRKMLDGELASSAHPQQAHGTYSPSIPRFRGLLWAWTYFF